MNGTMKIILTGATGFVGGEVLSERAARPEVTEITCLSRRPLPASRKTTTILHDDFATYDEALASRLAGHDACIWALGGKASDSASSDAYYRATYVFTLAFARTVAPRLERPFRFCYVSGMGADPTETAWLPWERTTRHLKGRVERELEGIGGQFRATAFRPAGILPRDARLARRLLSPIAVGVDELARALVSEACSPRAGFRVLSNRQIQRHLAPAG